MEFLYLYICFHPPINRIRPIIIIIILIDITIVTPTSRLSMPSIASVVANKCPVNPLGIILIFNKKEIT